MTCAALVGALCAPGAARAMDLAESGSWSPSISSADLVAGAGTQLSANEDSATSEVILDITLTGGDSDAWRVDVRRADSAWDADLHVWVRRTGSGSGTGTITDGLSWTEVLSTDATFYSGAGDRTNVPVQIRVTGISLSLSPDAYLTSLHYTLVDTL